MPTASAIPPSVIELRVSPKRSRTTIETSNESGIEISTISDDRGAAVQDDRILQRSHLRGAAGQDHVLLVDRAGDVRWREAPGEELLQIEVDLDLAHLAAHGQRELRALHRGQAGAQEVGAEVEDLLL